MIEIIKRMTCDKCKREINTGYEINFDRADKDEKLLEPEEDIYVISKEKLYHKHLCSECAQDLITIISQEIQEEPKEEPEELSDNVPIGARAINEIISQSARKKGRPRKAETPSE